MFSTIWHTFFFDPVYNTLVFFISIFPRGDVGLAIIATILLVKTILLPLSIKAVKTQKIVKEIEPKLKEIKEKYKDDRQAQAEAMMAVYKEANMNPLASIALIFIQLPIIIALYYSVSSGGGVVLPGINADVLYGFLTAPLQVSMNFLNIFDITQKSILLAVGAGVTQYLHVNLTIPALPPRDSNAAPDFKEEFARNMQTQMKYVMPLLIVGIAYSFSATIALYFMVSNIVSILQEFFIKKHR